MKKPAEAEKYRLEKIAEAQAKKVEQHQNQVFNITDQFLCCQTVLEAEAEAEVQALRGEAEAYAIEVKAKVCRFLLGLYKGVLLARAFFSDSSNY